MLTPKQKAYLKGLANPIQKRHLLGKEIPDEAFLKSIDAALEAHELIKIGLLSNSPKPAKEVALSIAEATKSEVVQVIGNVIVLYRRSKKHPAIEV